jgi:hypothetical protein
MSDIEEVEGGQMMTFRRRGQDEKKFVPHSAEERVIIPSNKNGTGFYRNTWEHNKYFLGGLLS